MKNITTMPNGAKIYYPSAMPEDEAIAYYRQQLDINPQLELISVDLEIDGAEVVIKPHYKTIKRYRRITGYISELNNFNSAKQSEANDRIKHVQIR